jgi:hypothetical protein
MARLGACPNDACARRLDPSPAFASALSDFTQNRWAEDEGLARNALDRGMPYLADHEDAFVERLTRELGTHWPSESVPLYISVHAAGLREVAVIDAPTLDTQGPCFDEVALLECALLQGLRALSSESDLGRAIEDERRKTDDAARDATSRLYDWVVVHAVADVVAEEKGYVPEEARSQLFTRNPQAFMWLEREWSKRLKGEGAREFGQRAVREIAESKR